MNSGGVRGLISTVATGRPAWMWHPGVTLYVMFALYSTISLSVG